MQTRWRSTGKRKSQQEIPLQEHRPRPLLISSGTGLLSLGLPVSPASLPPAFLSTGRKKTDKTSAQACSQLGWPELQAAGIVSENQQLDKLETNKQTNKQTNKTPNLSMKNARPAQPGTHLPEPPHPPTPSQRLGLSVLTTVYTWKAQSLCLSLPQLGAADSDPRSKFIKARRHSRNHDRAGPSNN